MIQSHLIQTEGNARYLIFDTVIDGKHLYTACGVGRVKGSEPAITEMAQKTLEALLAHGEQHGDTTRDLRLVEIATVAAAPVRVRKNLQAAADKDLVFFMCRDHQVYDAAVAQLNAQWTTGTGIQ